MGPFEMGAAEMGAARLGSGCIASGGVCSSRGIGAPSLGLGRERFFSCRGCAASAPGGGASALTDCPFRILASFASGFFIFSGFPKRITAVNLYQSDSGLCGALFDNPSALTSFFPLTFPEVRSL